MLVASVIPQRNVSVEALGNAIGVIYVQNHAEAVDIRGSHLTLECFPLLNPILRSSGKVSLLNVALLIVQQVKLEPRVLYVVSAIKSKCNYRVPSLSIGTHITKQVVAVTTPRSKADVPVMVEIVKGHCSRSSWMDCA